MASAPSILKTSLNKIKIPKNQRQHFYLFKSPIVVIPSFQLTRRIFNPIHIWYYKNKIEPEYTEEKFINGAIQATLLAAIHLRERRLDRFREISTDAMTNYLRVRLPELSQEDLDKNLNFDRRHIVNGFIHSSLFSMNNIIEAWLSKKIDSKTFHSTVVLFIDQSGKFIKNIGGGNIIENKNKKGGFEEENDLWTQPFPHSSAPTPIKLLKSPENLLICNLTLSRNVGLKDAERYGRWRITDINFFDCEFANDKLQIN